MQTITTIGLDIAKSVCQVHGVARATTVVADRPRRRTPATVSFTRFFCAAPTINTSCLKWFHTSD